MPRTRSLHYKTTSQPSPSLTPPAPLIRTRSVAHARPVVGPTISRRSRHIKSPEAKSVADALVKTKVNRKRKVTTSDDPDNDEFQPEVIHEVRAVRRSVRQASMLSSASVSTSRPRRSTVQKVAAVITDVEESVRRTTRAQPANKPLGEIVVIEHRSPEEDAWHEFVDKVREIHQEEPDWATVPFNAIDELNLMLSKVIGLRKDQGGNVL